MRRRSIFPVITAATLALFAAAAHADQLADIKKRGDVELEKFQAANKG